MTAAQTIQLEPDTAWERDAACADGGTETARLFFSDEITDIADAKRLVARSGKT